MKKNIIKGLLVSFCAISMISSASASTCTNLTKGLSKGSENSEVLALQQFLFDGGYLTVKPNGYFGVGTVSAVKKFQKANGLSQVGSVGVGTRGKIKEVSCKVTSSAPITQKTSYKYTPLSSTEKNNPYTLAKGVKSLTEAEFNQVIPVETKQNESAVILPQSFGFTVGTIFLMNGTAYKVTKMEIVDKYKVKIITNQPDLEEVYDSFSTHL